MAWQNSATDFALAALVIIFIASIILFIRCVLYPIYPAKFGSRLTPVQHDDVRPPAAAGATLVPIGIDPQTGQQIFQQQIVQQTQHPSQQTYQQIYHWSLQHGWIAGAIIIQGIIFVLYLSALSADTWSQYENTYYTMFYGATQAHSNDPFVPNIKYADSCDSVTGTENKLPCSTLRAAGALQLTYGLFGMICICALVYKNCLLLCCRSPANSAFHLWEYQFALGQSLFFGLTVFNWALSGHLVLTRGETGSVPVLGSSWALAFTCMVLSWFLVIYYKCAIDYRANGMSQPRLMRNVGVGVQSGSVVIVQPSPGIVIHQQPLQSQPQIVMAQPMQQINYAQTQPQPQPGYIYDGHQQQQQQQPQQQFPQAQPYPQAQSYAQPQPYSQSQSYPQVQPDSQQQQQYPPHPYSQHSHYPQSAQSQYPSYPPVPFVDPSSCSSDATASPPPYHPGQLVQPELREGQIPVTFTPVTKPNSG